MVTTGRFRRQVFLGRLCGGNGGRREVETQPARVAKARHFDLGGVSGEPSAGE